jgi:hypothetical protein
MTVTNAPISIDNVPSQMTAVVVSLRDMFTPTPGMNQPTTTPNGTKRPGGPRPTSFWWESTLTYGNLIPTEYLAQVPYNWPYTEYGIARKAGKTTSWPFVNPNATTKTVAWLYHEVLWNPRAFFTPKAEKTAKRYDPLLRGWSHDFVYKTITLAPTTASSTYPTTTPAPALSNTTPFSPTISQSSVLPKDPDSDGEIKLSMLSSSEAAKSRSKMQTQARVVATEAS